MTHPSMVEEVIKDCAIAAACHAVNLFDTSPGASKSDLVGQLSFVICLAIEKAMELEREYMEQIGYLLPSEN